MKKFCLFLFFFLFFGIKEEVFAAGTNVQPSCGDCHCDSSIKCNTDPCWFRIKSDGFPEYCSGHNMIWEHEGCFISQKITKNCCTSYAYVFEYRMYCTKCNRYFSGISKEFWEYNDTSGRNPDNHNGVFGLAYAFIDDCAGCIFQKTPIFNNGAINHKGEPSQHRIACAYCKKDGVALGYLGATITYDLNGGKRNISNQYNCRYNKSSKTGEQEEVEELLKFDIYKEIE